MKRVGAHSVQVVHQYLHRIPMLPGLGGSALIAARWSSDAPATQMNLRSFGQP